MKGMCSVAKKSNSQILRESKEWAEKRMSEIFETEKKAIKQVKKSEV